VAAVTARWVAVLVVLAAFALRVLGLPDLPPGLNMDEGFYGLDGLAVLGGEVLPFYPANGGREALFMVLIAPFLAILGRDPLALRLPAAFLGVLTVAAVVPLGWRLFRQAAGERAAWVGVVAAALAASSLWLVIFNRIGIRINAFPLLLAVAVYWFWRAWESHRARDWLIAGIVAGLTEYTYSAARILPLLLPGYALARASLELSLQPLRERWRGLVLFGVVAGLVATPLAGYALTHPEEFFRRQAKLNPLRESEHQAPAIRYLTALAGTLPMFVVPGRGDQRAYRNYPGAPVFDLALAPFFLLGLGLVLWRWRDPWASLLLLWFFLMVLAAALPLGVVPHLAHAFGLLPGVYLFPAFGLVATSTALFRRGVPRRLVALASAGLILASGSWAARTYFVDWAALPELPNQFDGDMREMAAVMNELAAPDTTFVIVQSRLYREGYRHGTVAFLYQGSAPYGFLRADEERIASDLATLVGDRPNVITFERAAERDIPADEKRIVELLLARQGELLWEDRYDFFRVAAWRVHPPLIPLLAPTGFMTANLPFGPVTLRAYAAGLSTSSRQLWAIAEWEATGKTTQDLKVSLRLLDAHGRRVGQSDRELLRTGLFEPTSRWEGHERERTFHLLDLPPGLPSGHYTLATVVYDRETTIPLLVAGSPEVPVAGVTLAGERQLVVRAP
jgi:4-amino-4-deoxy-L-arabinose transferase-like glycosyltransferase